ncbi:hypothetical protein KIH27_15600 [Mycobacterium sp. M1]|uniref:Uncharacterized protein n=1 Tax=Mycolicibacter acidiphilus TaxID=2835306 RepID=A0ABS5RN74_9MYCO|nr:hypothetical protein [Mycolicibacter acidiphilus]MBS9535014.1 hypothetical protein [Mycolicibacter acidiphilus]
MVTNSRLRWSGVPRSPRPQPCRWCGRDVTADAGIGRRRQYCRQSCRQRAYEQRTLISSGKTGALAPDSVVLSAAEATALSDRIYQVRCAAEDVATALAEGAAPAELQQLCDTLLETVQTADRWR